MLERRKLIRSLMGTGAFAILSPLLGARASRAQARPFVFCSWGGALSATEKSAFMDPASAELKAPIVMTSPTSYAKLKAMVDSNNVEWDLVDAGGRFIFQGHDEGLLEPIDFNIVDVSKLGKEWYKPYGVYTATGATVIAWNTKLFPAGDGPASWADFWDVKKFPGPRGVYNDFAFNYETGLLAAGVPREEVYPVTEERVRHALAKMAELKPHITVWWSSGAQPPQLLSSGELAMAQAWTGRITDIQKEGAPVAMTLKDGLAWGNAYVVPKGTPYRELAMRVINYAISETAQSRLLDLGVYGPVLGSVAERATPEQRRTLVTAPENRKSMLIFDDEQSRIYMTKYADAWNKFKIG